MEISFNSPLLISQEEFSLRLSYSPHLETSVSREICCKLQQCSDVIHVESNSHLKELENDVTGAVSHISCQNWTSN